MGMYKMLKKSSSTKIFKKFKNIYFKKKSEKTKNKKSKELGKV